MIELTRMEALDALEGMRQIVRREMLVRGSYIDQDVSHPRLVGAICGGRKHCAIGSLWAGGGVRPEKDAYGGLVFLPGTNEDERSDFLESRPGLRLAYDSLNESAAAFADKHGLNIHRPDEWASSFDAAIEGLFEGYYGTRLTKRDLLTVIAGAKRRVKAAV